MTAGKVTHSPKPLPCFIDQEALATRPLIPSRFIGFLPAMIEAGMSIYGDDWDNAEKNALIFFGKTSPNDRHVKKLRAAFAWLAQAILDKAVPVFLWYPGMISEPAPTQPGIISTDTENLIRRGYIWRDGHIYHIFVDRASLQAQLAMNRKPVIQNVIASETGEISLSDLSPYLNLAIAVALEQGISEAEASNVESLTEELLNRAPAFGLTVGGNPGDDFSKSFAEMIAKAIRWPSARAGRGKGKNQKP